MRYRIKDYSVVMPGGYIQISIPEPKGIFDGVPSATMDDANKRKVMEAVRLIADETKGGYVLMSTGQKSTLTFAAKSSGRIHLAFTFASLIAAADGDEDDLAAIAALQALPEGTAITDQFTIEMDWGDEPSGLSGGDAAEQVKDFFHIVKDGDTVKVITEDGGEEVVVPVELATEQEVKDINDDVMGALYGYGKVAVTIHSLMRTGAETTQDLASVIYVDPEKTWAENGYPTLYDDEGEPIDTTTNPAAGDEVFNYQIQSES